MTVYEPGREIELLATIDVLVAGGGVSGCAAAVAAARAGAETVLVERNGVLGGVATAGLMANIGNLLLDRNGRLVIRGITKEVIDRLVVRGAASAQWASREVPGIVVDSEQLKLVLARMLREAGVRVLNYTWAARPIMEGSWVRGAFVETKEGRRAILASVVVDATGEADLAARAGCPMRWTSGTASLEFKMGRVHLEELYNHFKEHPETFPVGMDMVKGFAEFERNWLERGIFFFPHGGGTKWDIFQQAIADGVFIPRRGELWRLDAVGLYGLRWLDSVIVNSNFWRVETLAPERVSRVQMEAQEACYYVADFMKKHVPGFEDAYIVQMASDLGIRVTRGIEGEATLTGESARESQPVFFDDVIGCRPAVADYSRTGEFLWGHTFDIPYGVLLPREVEGLLVGSGKSVSCQPQELIRGMSTCMVLGQAAGVAAALAAKKGVPPRKLDVRSLQRTLLEQGAYLGDKERLRELGL
ncbi:MAG: FAD-dependent oxidoreductase [Anaerolineae bacterium]|nr:FAD-dependent oxidoreductase [Anaerolineae bacterium]